ncbi:MAG: hypothetical protein V1829_01505 [bacterium]
MKRKFKILFFQNYLRMIKISKGSKMFQRLYVLENGKKKDILEKGKLSCALFVSSILKIFDLIFLPHTTVKGTINDMIQSGWKKTNELKPGNILLWEKIKSTDNRVNEHLGFYLGKDKAISNSSEKGVPVIRHFTFGQDKSGKPKRKIIKIFTHKIING